MSNETDGTVEVYNFISQKLTKYVGSCLYIVCLFSTVINMLTFGQRIYNRRACSLYILVASACDFIHLNIGLLSNILQYGFSYDGALRSTVYCKIKTYLVYIFTIISGTLTISAIINRYMLSSTKSSRWKYSRRSNGIRLITITIFFWIIMSIPILFSSQRNYHSSHNEQLMCSNSHRYSSSIAIQIIYISLFNGFLPPFIMMIVGFLTYRNACHLHQRSQSKSIRVRQINEQITSMLIIQSIKSTFTSIPYSLFSCYWILTTRKHKSLVDEAKENLLNEIVHLLFWSNYSSFLIYYCSSSVFRGQSIRAIKKLICCRYGKRRRHSRL